MATSHKYDCSFTKWSFGAELEFADWPRREPLLKGMAIDDGNWTTVNSDGVAADGPGKLYHLGGEILTAPSLDPEGPAEQMTWILNRWPETTINYRTGLNIHIRVPGLRDDLKKLKRLQTFIHRVMPDILPVIDAIPIPTRKVYPLTAEFAGAQKRYAIWKKDHHTLMPDWRLDLQRVARTPKEFFEAEAYFFSTRQVHWAIVPRACVNLRQLLQTDTLEFRHFHMPGTAEELLHTTLWCKMFLEAAFEGSASAQDLLKSFGLQKRPWPKFLPYVHWMERGFRYTSRHYHTAATVRANIETWLADKQKVLAGEQLCLQ